MNLAFKINKYYMRIRSTSLNVLQEAQRIINDRRAICKACEFAIACSPTSKLKCRCSKHPIGLKLLTADANNKCPVEKW